MSNFLKNYKTIFFLITFLLSLILLPLIIKVSFVQNDDWNRNLTVQNFLKGNFDLFDVTATTFYSQGLLGSIFLYILKLPPTKLPILTLIISCMNFLLASLIFYEFYGKGIVRSAMFGLLLFFFPLHFYSSIGFMTENYLLFFSLVSIFFFYKSQKDKQSHLKYIITSNIFWIIAFFSKQTALILPLAYLGQYIFNFLLIILKKEASHKKSLNRQDVLDMFITLVALLILVLYYIFLFPKTGTMLTEKSVNFSLLSDKKYVFSHFYAVTAYLGFFTSPILFASLITLVKKFKFKISSVLMLTSIAVYMYLQNKFLTSAFYFKIFPFYPNTFTPKGFFTQGLEGEKLNGVYQHVFPYIGNVSMFLVVTVSIFIFYIILNQMFVQKEINIYKYVFTYEIFALIATGILFSISPFVFDRYLLLSLPIGLFYIVKIKDKIIGGNKEFLYLLTFLLLNVWISLDYGIEYIDRNKKIWDSIESAKLSDTDITIKGTHAYNNYAYYSYLLGIDIEGMYFDTNPKKRKPDILYTFYQIDYGDTYQEYRPAAVLHSKGIFEKSDIQVWEKIK